MKDYSLDYESSKTFILNYNIENNQIIVNLASGEKYIIPYSVDNEEIILERMKNQVYNSSDCELNKQQKKFSKSFICAILLFCCFIYNIIILVTSFPTESFFYNFLVKLSTSFCAVSSLTCICDMISSKLKIRDIKKNKMFVKSEETLADNTKINQNVLSNVSKKTQELVASMPEMPEQKPIFNLNSIDKIGYKDLKQIIENIQRDEQFGFDYSESQDEKPMVLIKKRR